MLLTTFAESAQGIQEARPEWGFYDFATLGLFMILLFLLAVIYWIIEYRKDINRLRIKELELQIKVAERAIEDGKIKEGEISRR